MTNYDIIIIGGGIAGLYTQYKLLQKKHGSKILLIEKNNRLGGRIYTYKTSIKGKNYSMEAGAGRFNDNHKLLIKLITDLGFHKKIIKIGSKVNLLITKKKWKDNEISKHSPYDYLDFIVQKFNLKKYMKDVTFKNWLEQNIDKEIISYLRDFYPYKDVFKLNAYDALKLYKKDLNNNNNFYVLGGGLTQIINKLKQEIILLGGKIRLNTELLHISRNKNNYLITTNRGELSCKNIILTGQKPDLLKIKYLKSINPLLNTVRNAQLCRFYFIFDTKKCAWFKNIKKTITDSRLSYFIPINYETGLVMISYVDEYNATYLKKMEMDNKPKLNKFLLKECEKIFGIMDVPNPIWSRSFYWENGVGGWKVGSDSDIIEKKIIKPLGKENIFICGENYSSEYQCWIEGSLVTAENVMGKLG